LGLEARRLARQELQMQPLTSGNLRLAATIVLMRETGLGPEVFMTQRPGGVDFPDLHVFPGGKVDQQDFLPDLVVGLDDGSASRQLGIAAGGLRYWVAAIRECFEECGVLLAYRDGQLLRLSDPEEVVRFEGYRERLIANTLTLEAVCAAENLQLAADRVVYFSHWVTPEQAPRRFDTRFFIAAMPDGQETLAHAWETADDEWVLPRDALAAHQAGRWQMIAPTLITLASIAEFADVQALLGAVAADRHLPDLTDELRRQGMHDLR
jgi:8-oxo-dGTP pyrophosphatase MutT (NUDIX family)